MKESRLQRQIRETLECAYPRSIWLKYHGGPFTRAGVPDLLGCVNGLFIGLEVKRADGDKPTAIQLRRMEQIREAGGYAAWVLNEEQALECVREALSVSTAGSGLRGQSSGSGDVLAAGHGQELGNDGGNRKADVPVIHRRRRRSPR